MTNETEKINYLDKRKENSVFQSLRVDEDIITDFKSVCGNAGVNFSEALRSFCAVCVKADSILVEVDHAYSKRMDSQVRTGFWTSPDIKKQFQVLCKRMGFSSGTVMKMFMVKCIKEGKIDNLRIENLTCHIIMVDEITRERFKDVCDKNGASFSNALKQFCSDCIEKDGFPFEVDHTEDEQEISLKRTTFWTSEEIKSQFEEMCQRIDVSASTVLGMFMARCVEEGKINY